MVDRSFPAIDALVRQIEQSAADQPDALRLLGTTIRGMADEAVDPYLLAGLLIEGAVHAVAQNIPAGTTARNNLCARAPAYQSAAGAWRAVK